MRLLSINVGRPRPLAHNGELVQSGIFKSPVVGPVMLRKTNLDGDGQADLANHGGESKAVYAYSHKMYDYWQAELKRSDFNFGQFGENLTVSGMPDDQVSIGDVFRIGGAVVQVTQPRAPCFKLGIRMGDPSIVKRFLQTCRVGFYLRVLSEGVLAAGDAIEVVSRDPQRISVMEACRLRFFDKMNAAAIRRVLQVAALSPAWREQFENLL
jgi:MOSC domain-containing protein YiiM